MKNKENNMVIKVVRDGDDFEIYKPDGGTAGALSADFTVFPNPDDGKPVVYVKWHPNLPRPVVFEFQANSPITSVGFAGCYCESDRQKGIELYSRKGPCGGSFFLCTDLTTEGAMTVEVENWGHNRKDGYILNLAFGKIIFDPKILNEGELPPPGEDRRPMGCLGLFLDLFG